MSKHTRVVAVGECMVELGPVDAEGRARIAYGGDTLNTAVYLARLGTPTAFLTALGDDPFSGRMRAAWASEGVSLDLVATLPGRRPGLYAIDLDAHGERSFTYWRADSAARDLFRAPDIDGLLARAADADALYLSLITLSLFGPEDRARLAGLAATMQAAGKIVAFDTNYRPRGWADVAAARAAVEAYAPHVTVALPTLEDDQKIFGDADAEACIARWRAAGVGEVVVKQGAHGADVAWAGPDGPERAFAPTPRRAAPPRDTTGAGDSFNAGYLAARLAGLTPRASAEVGHAVAGAVIDHPGAIIPQAAMPAVRLVPAEAA